MRQDLPAIRPPTAEGNGVMSHGLEHAGLVSVPSRIRGRGSRDARRPRLEDWRRSASRPTGCASDRRSRALRDTASRRSDRESASGIRSVMTWTTREIVNAVRWPLSGANDNPDDDHFDYHKPAGEHRRCGLWQRDVTALEPVSYQLCVGDDDAASRVRNDDDLARLDDAGWIGQLRVT